MADPRLVELCELQKTGDEVFDVIDLHENQHSDILAWLLDPKEGHGQGDEILRDLLIRASIAVASGTSGLDGRSTTAQFFSKWTTSKIRTTSFAAAFTARELGMQASERVDLFVVDTQNEFVLLIENKAGSSHSESQLDGYRDSFNEAVRVNPRLRKFKQAYIALDWYFDAEDTSPRPSGSYWLHLGYDWLKTSAVRATAHVQRGNAAAQLVVSYCSRQNDWESPTNGRAQALAAEIHQTHPDAVRHLISYSRRRIEREWLTSKLADQSHLVFCLQNKSTIELLKESQGMASVATAVLSKIKDLQSRNLDCRRSDLYLCPRGCEDMGQSGNWPVYLNIRFVDKERSSFALAICWNAKVAKTSEQADRLRQKLTAIDSKFGKHLQSQWRRVVIDAGSGLSKILKMVEEIEGRLSDTLAG